MRARLDLSADPASYDLRHDVRVRFAETDAMGVVHHSAYVPMMEEARVAHLRTLGRPYSEIRDEGYDLPVLELAVRYRRPARFDDVVTIHSRTDGFRGATLQIDYLLTVERDTCALAATVHAVVDATGRAVRAPTWMKDLFAPGPSGSV